MVKANKARVDRGRRTQVVVAAWLRAHGWDRARAPVGAETGQDVKEVPGHSIEIKARADFDPRAWWRQAKRNAQPGQVPVVVMRCNGQGDDDPEAPGDYLVIRLLSDDVLALGPEGTAMLREVDALLNHPEFGSRYMEDQGGTPDR